MLVVALYAWAMDPLIYSKLGGKRKRYNGRGAITLCLSLQKPLESLLVVPYWRSYYSQSSAFKIHKPHPWWVYFGTELHRALQSYTSWGSGHVGMAAEFSELPRWFLKHRSYWRLPFLPCFFPQDFCLFPPCIFKRRNPVFTQGWTKHIGDWKEVMNFVCVLLVCWLLITVTHISLWIITHDMLLSK